MRPPLIPLLASLGIFTAVSLLASSGASPAPDASPRTYCNPLPLPNYPVGRDARESRLGDSIEGAPLWLLEHKAPFRELADPSVLFYEGKWYLYPSVDLAWVSEEDGATWRHHPLNIRDIGYAPTIVHHRAKFYLLAGSEELYVADSPLGLFSFLGKMQIPRPTGSPNLGDPMLYSEDGRLYFYWGCSPNSGLWGVELDATNPLRAVGEPREMIPFHPGAFPWEMQGEHNQNPKDGWLEGPWMLKQGGRYYLTYAAAGTENRTYAMGCYVGDSPLGPFKPQKNNPVLRTTEGVVTGTSHGCVVAGPGGVLRVFYTIRAGSVHIFERRIGMDAAFIDPDGELRIPGGRASSSPRWLPGRAPDGVNSDGPGWVGLNTGAAAFGSSFSPGQSGRLATDDDIRTWWQPAASDTTATLTSRLVASGEVRAVRIVWRDIGLDPLRKISAGAFRYRVEAETAPDTWVTILDRSANKEDLLIDYREVPATRATRVRLILLGAPDGITPGVADFTVFGTCLR